MEVPKRDKGDIQGARNSLFFGKFLQSIISVKEEGRCESFLFFMNKKIKIMTQTTEKRKLKTCEYCGWEFEAKNPNAQYCSNSCRQAAYRDRAKETTEAIEAIEPTHPIEPNEQPNYEEMTDAELMLHNLCICQSYICNKIAPERFCRWFRDNADKVVWVLLQMYVSRVPLADMFEQRTATIDAEDSVFESGKEVSFLFFSQKVIDKVGVPILSANEMMRERMRSIFC